MSLGSRNKRSYKSIKLLQEEWTIVIKSSVHPREEPTVVAWEPAATVSKNGWNRGGRPDENRGCWNYASMPSDRCGVVFGIEVFELEVAGRENSEEGRVNGGLEPL